MVKNKRGIIRIIEATIAVLIILSALLVLASQRKSTQITEPDLAKSLNSLLEEVASNYSLRIIVTEKTGEESEAAVDAFLDDKITNPFLDYSVRVCAPEEACGVIPYPSNIDGDLYAQDRIISSTLEIYSPKRVRIFLWRVKAE